MSTFSVKGVLSLDGSQFAGAMSQASRSVDRFSSSVGRAVTSRIAGLFTLGAAEEGIRRTIDFAGHIQDLSDRLGVSVEWLQEMQYVMKQNGGTADDLAKVLEKVADNRRLALSGSQKGAAMLQKFGDFGISPQELSTTGAQGLVESIAQAFKHGGSTEELSSAFREIGGKGARNLVSSFVDGIEQGRAAAQAAGAVMSDDVIAALDEIGDEFEELKLVVTVGLGPAILKVAGWFKTIWNVLEAGAAAVHGFINAFNWATIIGTAPNNIKEAAGEAATEFRAAIQEQLDSEERDRTGAAQRRASRRSRQHGEAIPIQTYEPKPEKFSIVSDALTAVGNFLGSNTQGTLTRLAQRQVDLLTNINRNIEKIANDSGSINDDFAND